ncbi:MAG: hypothetical protein ABUS56_10205 [Acidobacteriota bacterium]
MRSSNPRRSPLGRLLQLALVAAVVVAARTPFLLRADRFFNSDEAVEGLMARHVLLGEHPVVFWGQRYKGVPEVYLAAAAFAAAGPSVVVLKAVTLACFAAFAVAQFVLVERLFSRRIAWIATALLAASPPALVLWSLSASAEVVFTMLAGTVLCLGVDVWRRTGARWALCLACASLGFGLWVQQFIVYYIVGIAAGVLWDLPRRGALVRHFVAAPELTPGGRLGLHVLLAGALALAGLGVFAFVAGGFDTTVAGVYIGMHHPQKIWRMSLAALVLWALLRSASVLLRVRERADWFGVGLAGASFLLGYAPAIVGTLTARGSGMPPIGRAALGDVADALPPFTRALLPIVLGFRSPDTEWLGAPAWLGVPIAIAAVASFAGLRRRGFTPVFHAMVVAVPVILLLSGSFIDAQSYRYLMPAVGALSVVLAIGISNVLQRSRLAGLALLAVLVGTFTFEQRAWYGRLLPDHQTATLLACLDRSGVRAAYADYWVSYKVTFLAGERVIVVPNTGVDRFLPYRRYVAGQPAAPTLAVDPGAACHALGQAP